MGLELGLGWGQELYKNLKQATNNFTIPTDVTTYVDGANFIVSLSPLHKYSNESPEYMDLVEITGFYSFYEPKEVMEMLYGNDEFPLNIKTLWERPNDIRVGLELDTDRPFKELPGLLNKDYTAFKKWLKENK